MANQSEKPQKEIRMLPVREAILGGIALGVVTAIFLTGGMIFGKVSADSTVAAGTLVRFPFDALSF